MRANMQAGFSLLQLSIFLVIAGMILAATLPGVDQAGSVNKSRITLERMERIEQATRAFMAENHRRPYPAAIAALTSSSEFGKEITPVPSNFSTAPTSGANTHFTTPVLSPTFTRTLNSATLTSGTTTGIKQGWLISTASGLVNYTSVAGVLSASSLEMDNTNTAANGNATYYFRSPMVAGGVPVKDLGLSDDYAFDGFGRRIVYVVDQRATREEGCTKLQDFSQRGAISLSRSENFATDTYDHVMWALLSYGPDGQGAVSQQGMSSPSLSSRLKTGLTSDASTLVNAFYNSSQVNTFAGTGLVKKEATATFDDIVWTNPSTQNVCAFAAAEEEAATSGDFASDASSYYSGGSYLMADINGDTYPDMLSLGVDEQHVKVVFGKASGWPNFNTVYSPTMDGSGGLTLTNINTYSIVVGNVDGDSYNDIIIQGTSNSVPGVYIVFGKASWGSSIDISALSPPTGVALAGMAHSGFLAVGDVNNDTYADIMAGYYDTDPSNPAIALLYGKPTANWSNTTVNTAYLNGTVSPISSARGVHFQVPIPDDTKGDIMNGAGTIGRLMCDINNDGYKDMLIPSLWNISYGGTSEDFVDRIYVKLGGATLGDSSGAINASLAPMFQIKLATTSIPGSQTHHITHVTCGKFDNDAYDDILMYMYKATADQGYIYVYRGSGTPLEALNIDSSYDARFLLSNSDISWFATGSYEFLELADMNGDGKNDLLFNSMFANPYVTSSGSTFTLNNTNTGTQRSYAGVTWVLYQPNAGWSVFPMDKNLFTDYSFNGTNGFTMVGSATESYLRTLPHGDMDKDGKTDVFVSMPSGNSLLFGKTTWPAAYDFACIKDMTPAYCTDMIKRQ